MSQWKASIGSALSTALTIFSIRFHRDKRTVCIDNVNVTLFILVTVVLSAMLNIHLRSTGERFTIRTISFNTKVRDLKTILEIICGVPAHLQWLYYLDESSLLDAQRLKYYDPVPNCTFVLDVWFIYEPIVKAVVANDEAKVTV